MTKDERYYTNMLYNALKSILSDYNELGYNLPTEHITNANRAIQEYDRAETIKTYKALERKLYQSGQYEQYKQLKAQRLELEKGGNNE